MPPIIDAHQHFWQLDGPFDTRWLRDPAKAAICRDFLPTDLAPHLAATGVQYSVFVQTQHNLDENRWALELADRYPFLAGVVGWIDLASPACEEQLVAMRRHPKFVGVRHIVQDEPDDDFIVRPDVLRGLKVLEKHGVPFDMFFYVKHLRHAATLAREFPNLSLILDHLSKPHIKAGRIDDWLPNLKAAAQFPNVTCKLSGMVTEADWKSWKPADLAPYVRAALEHFGPRRCLFGSDWPVCELAATYEQTHAALVDALGPLSPTDKAAIFGGNAQRVYQLNKDLK